MGLLDVILEMQSQGLGEEEITENLRQQGFSAREIQEALSQLQVREAVSQEYSGMEAPQPGEETSGGYDYQQSYPPYAAPSVSSEMVSEIVEQVVAEKFSGLNKTVSSLSLLKSSFEEQLKSFEARIRKIEENMDSLQKAILGKIGEYGKDMKSIHQEMNMMQESFSKALNPLMDKARGTAKVSREKNEEEEENEAGEEESEEREADEKQVSEEPKEESQGNEEEESGLEREHFNFDLLRKIGKGKS